MNWFEDEGEGEATSEDDIFCNNYILSELLTQKYPQDWFSDVPCDLQLLITYIEKNKLWNGQDIDKNLKVVKDKIMQDYFIKYEPKELCYKFDFEKWNAKKITKSANVTALNIEREKDKTIFKLLRDYWDDLFFESSKQKKCNTFNETSSTASKIGYVNQLCSHFIGTCYLADGSKFKWKDGSYKDFPDPRMYYNAITGFYDLEKLKTDLWLFVNTKYAGMAGVNSENSNLLQYNKELWLSMYAEYMYQKGYSEIDGISTAKQQSIRRDFYNLWGSTDENGFYWKWNTLNQERVTQERQNLLQKLQAEDAVKNYLEDKKDEAAMGIVIGGVGAVTGVAVMILFPPSTIAAAMFELTDIGFSAAEFAGGYNQLRAIQDEIFDPNKHYNVIEGVLYEVSPEHGGLFFDLATIIVGVRSVDGIYHHVKELTTVSGNELKLIIAAAKSGTDEVVIGGKIYSLVHEK